MWNKELLMTFFNEVILKLEPKFIQETDNTFDEYIKKVIDGEIDVFTLKENCAWFHWERSLKQNEIKQMIHFAEKNDMIFSIEGGWNFDSYPTMHVNIKTKESK